MNALTDLDTKADESIAAMKKVLADNAAVHAELTVALANADNPAAIQAIADKLQRGVIDPAANVAVEPPVPVDLPPAA